MTTTMPNRDARTVETENLSPKARRAIKKYGYTNCELAYTHSTRGEGPHTISIYVGLSGVAAANAAINAGREIANARN